MFHRPSNHRRLNPRRYTWLCCTLTAASMLLGCGAQGRRSVGYPKAQVPPPLPAQQQRASQQAQLEELHNWCQQGLLQPAVCAEKQRAILGLRAVEINTERATLTPAPSTPSVSSTQAMLHRSSLGFQVRLPSGWSAPDAQAISEGVDAFLKRLPQDSPSTQVIRRAIEKREGQLGDMFIHPAGNIQIRPFKQAHVPADQAQLTRLCSRLRSSALNRAPVTSPGAASPEVWQCEIRTMGTRRMLFVRRRGVLPGTQIAEYWIPPSEGTATALSTTLNTRTTDTQEIAAAVAALNAVVASLQWL